MKRSLALLLALVMVLALLTGCSGGGKTAPTAAPTQAPAPTAAPTQAPAPTEAPKPTAEPAPTEAPAPTAEPAPATRTVTDMKGNVVEIPYEVHTYVESWFAHNAVDLMLDRAEGMLITCARPSHLMFGKVIGSGLAGLTQLVLILSTALVSINTVSKDTLPTEIMDFLNFPLATVLYALLFFVLGYFIYSFLLGALSSLASRSEDLNTLISPVMILFIAAFLIVVMAINSDSVNGTLMVVCSYIPFTAPLAMFARIVLSDVAVYEIIISVAVQLISVYLLGMLAAAIYRIGVLMYGNPPKPSEIVKMLKEQHKANKAVKESIKTK